MFSNIISWFLQMYDAIIVFFAHPTPMLGVAAITGIVVGAAIGWYLSK